jgi:hypothetical protein
MTWQASWPPTRSRFDSRHPPDSNSSGVLGPARRGRGTVGDDLCVRPNHAALDPHERPVHWPSPRAQSWCSDGSPAKAASRSPARSSRSATATPAGPSPCLSLAQSDQRIDRPLLPERPPSGRPVSGTRGQAGVCSDLWPGRVSGRLPHAGHQRGHGWSLRQPPRTWQLVWRAAGHGSGTAATAGHSRVQTRWAWSVSCQHGDPDRPCGEQEWTAADIAGHFRCGRPLCRRGSGHRGRSAASGVCPAASVARGTGRRVGGRWWDSASAGGCERAGRSGGRGIGRGRRSSPAGRASGPPRS